MSKHKRPSASKGTWPRPTSSKMFDLVYSESLSVASCRKKKKSQLLELIQHVVCCPGSGFCVGPPSTLIFQASGAPAVVEGPAMICHPAALFCGCEAQCFPPRAVYYSRALCTAAATLVCAHRWLRSHVAWILLFTFLFVRDTSPKGTNEAIGVINDRW